MLSAETAGIIALLKTFGLPFRITSITEGSHATTSYHYRQGTGGRGLAVDIAGPIPYRLDPAGGKAAMLAICKALRPYERNFAELICSHLSYSVRDGQRVGRMSVASHYDHIHLAVKRGTLLARPTDVEVTVVPDDPNLPNIEGPLTFHPCVATDGMCKGYYIFSVSTSELHAFGPGAPYYGRSEELTPD